MKYRLALVIIMATVSACTAASSDETGVSGVTKANFGQLGDGRTVTRYAVRNASGAGFDVIDLGAVITSLVVPDREGALGDVVLGFEEPEPYLTDSPYFGAIVGRYANRIANGRFSLGGEDYELAVNNGPNALHGGLVGFDKRSWTADAIQTEEGRGVRMTLISPDGEEGYPGEVVVAVSYVITDRNELIVDYAATAKDATILNISQHSYFNLAGHDAGSVLGHELQINADFYTPVDETLIPTGEILAVSGSPFDFGQSKQIGRDIETDHEQLKFGGGYDHNFVLRRGNFAGDVVVAAILSDPVSGRRMTISTDQPGLQFYSGNFLDGSTKGKGGTTYNYRNAVALETQHYPDSPNQPHFPRTALKASQTFNSRTVFSFDTDN